jgi:NAD-reducing hydrogenase large subunit
LIHNYWVNENGQIQKVNLIVSTGHNNWAMCEAVDSVAKTYITGPEIHEGLLNRVEAAIRAHDPCLSCSTHAVGQMPLTIEIKDESDKLVRTITRE